MTEELPQPTPLQARWEARLAGAGGPRAFAEAAAGKNGVHNIDQWWPQWVASQHRDNEKWMAQYRAANCSTVEQSKPRQRKPSIRSLLKQAEKSGKQVSSVTTPEGYTLNFGKPEADQTNNLDKWMAKHNAH